uniref:Uncharacterized protein n=1 Tax=Arundo donax TaxID=35708 RepID=A0A0A8ZN03_ARUDO
MGSSCQSLVWKERVVLLQPEGPQVPQWRPPQPRRRIGLLEGHRHRQGHPVNSDE